MTPSQSKHRSKHHDSTEKSPRDAWFMDIVRHFDRNGLPPLTKPGASCSWSSIWPTRRESSIQGPGPSPSRRGSCVGFTWGVPRLQDGKRRLTHRWNVALIEADFVGVTRVTMEHPSCEAGPASGCEIQCGATSFSRGFLVKYGRGDHIL